MEQICHTYDGSEFALSLGKCPVSGTIGSVEKTEAIVRLKGTNETDISSYIVEKIINCVISLILPGKPKGAIGTETKLEISFINQVTTDSKDIPKDKLRLIDTWKVLNAREGRGTLHANVVKSSVVHGDTGIISLDFQFTFFTKGIVIGHGRYQISPTSRYSLEF